MENEYLTALQDLWDKITESQRIADEALDKVEKLIDQHKHVQNNH